MALQQFRIKDIGELDSGRPAAMIDKAIRSAIEDCSNRPGVARSRKVTVVLEIEPVAGEEGVCEEVNIDVVSSCSLPKSHSKTLNMGVRPNGQLVFNPGSDDNVRQGTLDEAGGRIEPKLEE